MRVYIAATMGLLAEWFEAGRVPAGGERFIVPTDHHDDRDLAEYAALTAAAESAADLLGSDAGRRIVVVAEIADDPAGRSDPDAPVLFTEVAAVHADMTDVDPAATDLPELGWFATQEVAHLLGG